MASPARPRRPCSHFQPSAWRRPAGLRVLRLRLPISRRLQCHGRRTQADVERLMSDVTHILSAIEQGDPHAAEQLLPLVYDELRKLAGQKMAQEAPGQTLQATGLVHEAYLRLVDVDKAQHWNSRGHFFAASAEAMRRNPIHTARRKKTEKHGGKRKRIDL